MLSGSGIQWSLYKWIFLSPAVKHIFGVQDVHGMAHITGGGIEGNLCRIIPDGLCAKIDSEKIKPVPIFGYIQKVGNVNEEEMLSTFNCGVGLTIVVSNNWRERIIKIISEYYDCYEIGIIAAGNPKIKFNNHIVW